MRSALAFRRGLLGLAIALGFAAVVVAGAPSQLRWSIVLTTAAGLPQDVWISGMGNNGDGWTGGGVICLGHLAQGFLVGEHVTLKSDVVEGGIIGEDASPVEPGIYVAPSGELGNREFEVVAGETFYMIVDTEIINSNVAGFEVGDRSTIMFTFDATIGRANQPVVLWGELPDGSFAPFLNEGVMMTNLRQHR